MINNFGQQEHISTAKIKAVNYSGQKAIE